MVSKKELANAIRFLSIDAVEKAQSGHPGMPMGMADIAATLWLDFLNHNPKNPDWFNRDRFVLSNGHGSMLLYALLHLTGYKVSIEDLKQFRQLHSITPGHPECGETPGVETTTGPLGQGLANAVGMAIAEKILAARFNAPGFGLVDHYTYTFVGDGCLMEGISHEACSLAGTLQLGKLIAFYDDNGISIDGEVKGWFTDDTVKRFESYGWQVIGPINGHEPAEIGDAIVKARAETVKPTLIICKTQIGFGCALAGSEKVHGSPLGADVVEATRKTLNWPYLPFEIPTDLQKAWDQSEKGNVLEQQWHQVCYEYKKQYPEKYQTFLRTINGDLPDDWQAFAMAMIEEASNQAKPEATRKSSQWCIERLAPLLPELLGGSADLTGSNNTDWSGTKIIAPNDFSGNYLSYGVREFAMAAIMNGIALHKGLIPYGGTFLVFSDYARNAIRLSALMKQRVIYVLTHDSIGLGEDGPTHQPVEHAAMLRMTPGVLVWRPADLTETAVAWTTSVDTRDKPSCLLLSRQNLPPLKRSASMIEAIHRGGYILHEPEGQPEVIVIATGSEVHLALDAATALAPHLQVRVVSMPCPTLFLMQAQAYQDAVLSPTIRKRVAIEALKPDYWYRFVGLDGKVIGVDTFGVSAKASDAYKAFGITKEAIMDAIKNWSF